MARVRTVDFLPEIFQTSTNKQFLSATLDQLVQEPKFKKSQGFVGRRVGPGVDATDRYIIEPTSSRNNYQLEPGVILKKTDSTEVKDLITYPGISDALSLQGAVTDDASRLYTSDYYTWDPFVNFDKFVNFSQYYWLPGGPDSVNVSATTVPMTDNFVVTRENGVYTFSGQLGNDPTLTLVRGGNYTFQVAQNNKETVNYRVANQATSAYVIDYISNPTLTLVRGNTYVFNLVTDGVYPFWIKTESTLGLEDIYEGTLSDGSSAVLRNGAVQGNITFTVPQDAPDTLYYVCQDQTNMRGVFNIIDASSGTGPGFWIQAEPGISGTLPYTPNISSRTVLGVSNNGEDLGTITFNVPQSTAQNFYYSLNNYSSNYSTVDFATNLLFNQVNNQPLNSFIETYGGIDGITSLNGRTIIFLNQSDAGWEITTTTDGGFGETFDETTPITDPALRYSVWQIQYETIDHVVYIKLSSISTFPQLTKCSILYGDEYASTQWYKDAEGFFQEIPLLTAIKDTLYYQDGTDPEIFGRIKLIDPTASSTIDIDDIIGKTSYTSPNGVVFTNGLKVTFVGSVNPSSYQNNSYYVEGVGTAIKLIAVSDFVTPETYTQSATVPFSSTGYDVGNWDASLNEPAIPDYITINRASPDLNAWSRSNRWFHIDVINASASYNNVEPAPDNNFRAKRPILEFHPGTRLFDMGTQGKQPVNIIDFSETDAFSNINGTLGYGVDGYQFIEGTRVIFAADADPDVRNKIYVVQFITPDTVAPIIAQPIINLVPATDSTVLVDQNIVCLNGLTLQGKSFYFDGVDWLAAQEKTDVNQPPLFNVYDPDGISLSDRVKYPSTTFVGSKLFSYAVGSGTDDTVLGFPLRYLSLTNVGDIVFENNLYTDTFTYVPESVSYTDNISIGFVRQYADRTVYNRAIGWTPAITKSLVRQQFQFKYDGTPLRLDIKVNESVDVPAIHLYVGQQFQSPDSYTVNTTDTTTTIVLNKVYVPGSVIEVDVLSDQTSQQGFYVVPTNLENNPFNVNSPIFTLGTVRSHYETIGENLIDLVGPINGANNSRDLGNIGRYGTQIVQQSSPLTLAGFFMRSKEYDIFASLEFNSREYIKFKNKLLETVIREEWGTYTTSQILDAVITQLGTGKTNINSFYWSDMLPAGSVYTENTYKINPISTSTFDTVQTYDFTSANYKGLLVYVTHNVGTRNEYTELLDINTQYVVATDGPRLTITSALTVGDIVTIREYANTAGTFVPNTPTKLGLYPSWEPRQYIDTNYVNPTSVIQGHDGSITVAFNDIRDEVLLEFEKRIFNNLKNKDNPIPLTIADVVPGYFRTTDYTQTETTTILSESFLTWVGWNKLDYKTQDFNQNNPFTYNYSQAGDKQNDQPLLGAWRGISKYFYDTLSPNTTPWEMLGFSLMPTWWEDRYGPAPYTSNNLVLWEDLEAGYVADPLDPHYRPEYARPGLVEYFIPVGDEGELLAPINSVVGPYDPTGFRKSWVVGDGGPVEASWWMSSSYPFAVMRLLALTRPAEFFSLFADRDLYKYDYELNQYLYNERYRLDASGVQVYGNGVSKASYINWIVDFNQQLGLNSTTALETALANLDVRLCWRMASFSDKQYIKVYTERSSPNSLNSSLLLPDESYKLMLYKNTPFDSVTYSSVIVQKTDAGYAVYGYSVADPYFEILASRANGNLQRITSGGSTVQVPRDYSNDVVQVPYGFVFANETVVVDFLLSYGRLLEDRGLVFDDKQNGYVLNWFQMAQEFLYWANQGWGTGAIINLNPCARRLIAEKAGSVVDSILTQNIENLLIDQNRQPLDARNLIIERLENNFTITSANEQTISYVKLNYTNYEHILVLDNVSIFQDLIYNPATGARQNRISVTAATSTDWNGTLDAQGFILNNPETIQEWSPTRKYAKGEIVKFKNNYWSAQTIVQPAANFDYQYWVKSDYTEIQQGLLPNIPNKADQLSNSYNTQVANLESDNDLLSYGLIGFRPREYMSALNLDDISQVNLYQQFLGTKGTTRAAEIFTGANLGKEVADYQIYENWAVQRGVYGANANRSFFELRLNEALLPSDPSTIQVVLPGEESLADQKILLSDVWKQSYKLTSPDILPTTYISPTDTGLPSAGYVNIDDVDITVFSLDNPSSISEKLDQVGIGTKIWVAKSNSYDWDVYRCNQTPGFIDSVSDNLDGSSLVHFTKPHGLSRGDLLIIRFFNSAIDGVYRVLSTPSQNTLTIAYTFPQGNTTGVTGTGLSFFLQTMRVSQASDVLNLPYVNDLVPGALAWVDNNGAGLWEVLEKQATFTNGPTLEPSINDNSTIVNAHYGSSIAQAYDNLFAFVGAPGFADDGGVYTYLRGTSNAYFKNSVMTLNALAVKKYGNAVEIGYQSWGAVGAENSNFGMGYVDVIKRVNNNFEHNQLIIPEDYDTDPTGRFGYSVSMSNDERWLYVGQPDNNKVHAYGRIDVQTQDIVYITDGVNNIFNYSDSITINSDEQLFVQINNKVQIYGVDYTVNALNVAFTSTPPAGQRVYIARRQATQLDQQTYFNVEQSSTSGSGSGAQFTVDRTRGFYTPTLTAPGINYTVGDTLTIAAADIDGGTSPTNDLTITVVSVTSGGITAFSYSGEGVDDTSVFALNPYLYTATNIYSFTVTVNDQVQRPFIDYTFDDNTTEITFIRNPEPGTNIIVTTDAYWQYIATMTGGAAVDSEFGSSVSTTVDGRQVSIGCPNDTVSEVVDGETITREAGSVYVYDRSVVRYLIDNTSQTTFGIPGSFQQPVAVLLNGEFLTNKDQYVNGQFEVSGSDVILSNNVTLQLGDVLEIETNEFQLVQQLQQTSLYDEARYGAAVDICPTSCSYYIGAPQDGKVLPGAGSVDRWVNQARVYGVISSTVANPTLIAGDTIRVNDYEVAVPNSPNNTVNGLAEAIDSAVIPNVTASVSNGILTINVKSTEAATDFNKLSVLPGLIGTAFADLGFTPLVNTQTIVSPNPGDYDNFGTSVFIDSSAVNLVVGAPRADLYEPDSYDDDTTYFDDRSTTFFDQVIESGVVFTYDYLPSASDSVTDSGKFVFGQQIYNNTIASFDEFGASVNYTSGRLLVGSPGNDAEDSTVNYGRVNVFDNADLKPSWVIKHIQQPVVDVRLLNSVFMYDKLENSVTSYLDFFNPLQGKILGIAKENIDYIGAVDPANYNNGPIHNNGTSWGSEYVGQIWWDTNSVRFIDPNQDDIVYASRRWGQLFPGSRVDIYQWIESTVPPNEYTGPGTVLSTLTYTTRTGVNNEGIISTRYYFWVRNISTVATTIGKKLSTTAIANYIENPRASGIAYLAPLNASTVAIYNVLDLISAQDTILHIEYDRELNDDNVHVEYELIAQDRGDAFLSGNLYLKLQDSFCGVNLSGALVPDPTLSPAEQYGVQFRPRQSMFADRFAALKNYLERTNRILALYPISETRKFNLLNSSEPEPTVASGAWDKRVANLEELGYQNLAIVPVGYKYLVASDSSQGGLWTIYEVEASQTLLDSKELVLIRVQNYDTKRYWNYIDWYLPGYNSTINPVTEVPVYSGLDTISVPVGSSVKVTANAQGKFEIYQRTLTGWDRVGLEDGTIEFKEELWDYTVGRFGFDVEVFDAQYFDQEPVIETRKIIQAINEELFVDDLAIERNRNLMIVFEFVYSEFTAPEWLMKTSLVDVDHKIRDLVPYQIYRQDNQDFVLDYIQEVKPYHVQVREFNLTYDGSDFYNGSLTDFDVPAYWDTSLEIPQFVSPILLPFTQSSSTTGQNTVSNLSSNSTRWQTWPWSQWYNNYLLSVQSVEITNGGVSYTVPPEVIVTGDCVEPAEMTAIINSAGQVVGVDIINPGVGYSTTAVITFTGGNGAGARGYAIMGNDLVRSIKTIIKYDRYQYQSTIVDWEADVTYSQGTQVRYLDQVWSATETVTSSTFDPDQWTLVDASTLSGVDRTMGLYVATPNQPGLSLPLLIDGIDYPGVQVKGVDFSQNTGYDVGNYDINPYDNISYGPEGRPTYDPAILDAIYESYYIDEFLGTRSTDINVDGGAFVDTYSSHAPEELIPGAEFDTLDLRVYTNPGADWAVDGHGFPDTVKKFLVTELPFTFSFANLEAYPATILVFNQTTGVQLYPEINYSTDWADQTVTVTSGIAVNDTVAVIVYEVGGGNQLFKKIYRGDEVEPSLLIPVPYASIQEFAIFVNGELVDPSSYVAEDSPPGSTVLTFATSYTDADLMLLVAIAPTTIDSSPVNYSWSAPVTQYITANGSLIYTLTNSLEYSNPDCLIVTVNGNRARTAAGAEYYADGSTEYLLPERLGFSQSIIADPEVHAYIDDVAQILGVDYFVEPYDGVTPRSVIFASAPDVGSKITIYVTTNTQAWVNGNQLFFNSLGGLIPIVGDIISVTTWNDTRQQDILTQVYVGPDTGTVVVQEGYDDTTFDQGDVDNEPGSYDYAEGQTVVLNDLFLNRAISNPDRLWVTLNGRRLFVNDDFLVEGAQIILNETLQVTDIVMITEFTNSVVPEAMAFRIFQDMRGVQATYRITTDTTTALAQELSASADTVYLVDASALSEPNLNSNIWGVLTVDGERIMYRERDVINNTVSGLLRGSAGTAINDHSQGAVVYDMGRGNLMPEEYQNYIDSKLATGDGSTTDYYTEIVIDNRPIVSVGGSVAVYVNSVLQTPNKYTVTTIEPVTVVFDSIPVAGANVTISVTDTLAVTTSNIFTATGSTPRFPTNLDIGLVELESADYRLDDFEPVVVTLNEVVPEGQVVFIANQRGAEDEFDFFFSDGVETTYTTTINLTLPIEVYVGGNKQTNTVDYNVTTLDPVLVEFTDPPANGLEVLILVRRGVTWYQGDGVNPSNGVALQDTQTAAARFLRGEI